MIYSRRRLREVLEEISEWDLPKRREYIADLGKAFGEESAQQIRDGLTNLWNERQAA